MKQTLDNHIKRVHEGQKPHQCYLCTMAFTLRHELNRHIFNTHQDEKKSYDESLMKEGKKLEYKCEACQFSFATKHFLQKHITSMHPNYPNQSPGMYIDYLKKHLSEAREYQSNAQYWEIP